MPLIEKNREKRYIFSSSYMLTFHWISLGWIPTVCRRRLHRQLGWITWENLGKTATKWGGHYYRTTLTPWLVGIGGRTNDWLIRGRRIGTFVEFIGKFGGIGLMPDISKMKKENGLKFFLQKGVLREIMWFKEKPKVVECLFLWVRPKPRMMGNSTFCHPFGPIFIHSFAQSMLLCQFCNTLSQARDTNRRFLELR